MTDNETYEGVAVNQETMCDAGIGRAILFDVGLHVSVVLRKVRFGER